MCTKGASTKFSVHLIDMCDGETDCACVLCTTMQHTAGVWP